MSKPKKVRFPENLFLKLEVSASRQSVKDLAEAINVSRGVLSHTINGHYKGENIVPKLQKELSKYDEVLKLRAALNQQSK